MNIKSFFLVHHFILGMFMLVMICGMPVPAVFAEETPAAATPDPQQSMPKPTAESIRFKGGLPEVLPIPGDIRPYAKSPYATQIDKALAYLAFKDRDSNRNYRLVLWDDMQRKYGLPERYSLKATRAPHLLDDMKDDLGNMKRLTDPNFKVELSAIENASPLERIALRALYCDIYPVETTLLDEMNEMIQQGMSPFLPTLGIAYLFLRDHGCLKEDAKRMLVRDALAVKFRNHLRDNGLNAYMAGQALALLFEIGHGEMVEENWLTSIAKAQNKDGGWSVAPGSDDSGATNGMTTTHVLWALLEHALPDAPDTPLVRKAEPAALPK